MRRVQRTSAYNEREYGQEKWPAVERIIDEALSDGEHELARVVARTARRERRLNGAALTARLACLMGTRMQMPVGVVTAAHDALVVESVLDACRPDTDLIIELGAGWGRNLAAVWLGGGPVGARHVCAEVTESGRRAAQRIAGLAAEFDLSVTSYDFERPVIGELPAARHAVVFTCHGIGAVPELPIAAIDSMLSPAPAVSGVHVEPIGWQIRADHECNPARYAAEHDYNHNLWMLLRQAEAQGHLTIDRVIVDAIGGNPLHPSSLVSWHAPVG